jgi:hypothetical protein
MAMILSSLERNLASMGESGIHRNMMEATATVTTPKKRKMTWYGLKEVSMLASP